MYFVFERKSIVGKKKLANFYYTHSNYTNCLSPDGFG